MNESRSLWWLRPVLGAAAAVALISGGLTAFLSSESGRQAPPGPVIDVPAVTVPLTAGHWPGPAK